MPRASLSPYDVPTLLLLLDVRRLGSITAAAEEWQMTASAASQRIGKLERLAGQPLLVRLPRGVRLTPAGATLAEHAEQIQRELQAAQGSLRALRALETGGVRLGSFPTASASLVSDVLRDFHRRYPGVQVEVHSALRDELVELMRTNSCDLTAMWSYAAGADLPTDVAWQPLGTDPSVLLVASGAPWSGEVNVSDLAGQPWLVRTADHPATAALQGAAARAGFHPEISYRAHDYQEMQAMIAAGFGVAMVPRLAVEHHRGDVRVLPLAPDPDLPLRTILLGSPLRAADSPATAALRRAFVTRASRLLDPLP